MAHEMNNIPVALAGSGILLRKDIYQRLRNTPEWGRMKRKLSVENLRVLEIPEDFLPVVLESLPEEFYLDRKSVSAIADLQLKYEAFCSLFYPSFHDGYPKYEVYEEAYRQPELIVGDDYEAQNIVRMALSRRMFQIERKKEQLSLNENCVTNKLTLKNNVALKNQKVSTLDTQTPKILLTLEELEELFKKYHLQKRWFAFKVFLRSGISLDIQSEEKRFPLGCSRIGGLPDLPSDVEWPFGTDGSLAFLGQFNMNELKPLDIERRLPSRGMLYFFYHAEQKAWGVSIQDFGNWSVLYSKTTRGLKRATLPKDLNAQYHQFPDCKVSFAFLRQIPSPDHPFLKDFFEKEDESESYSELYEEYKNILPSSSYLLGYPVPIQNDMEESCESIYCDHLAAGIDRTDQKTINTLKYAVLWRNLLQLSSEGEANMNWGDCGQLNFMIREDELKEKHFANVWMELQCY